MKNDIVQLLAKDRTFPCAYVGQLAKVTKPGKVLTLVLRCGHLWECSASIVKKVGHEVPKPRTTNVSFRHR